VTALRAGLVALALVACAWFALGVHQGNAVDDASAVIAKPNAGGASAARHAAALLDDAAALNPDRQVDVLRGILARERGDLARAKRILRGVVRREPENLQAWIELARSSGGDPRTALNAIVHVRKLVPAVPPPH
jgi:hypothetical protein